MFVAPVGTPARFRESHPATKLHKADFIAHVTFTECAESRSD